MNGVVHEILVVTGVMLMVILAVLGVMSARNARRAEVLGALGGIAVVACLVFGWLPHIVYLDPFQAGAAG